MKKVLIIPSNTDLNRGDQALVWESIRIVKDIYNNNVECLLMGDLDSHDSVMQNRQTEALGFKIINTIIKHPGRKFAPKNEDSKSYSKLTMLQWGCQALVDYFQTRMLLSQNMLLRKIGFSFLTASQKKTIEEIKNADSVFVKGGGFIHSYGAVTDPYFIYYLTYHIRLAEAFGKKVVMLPNSIGPLKNKNARQIAVEALRNCTFVSVRENISKQCLVENGVTSELYPDLGFFLSPSDRDMEIYLRERSIPINKKKVVITLRPYRFPGFGNPSELFNNYLNGVKSLVGYLVNNGYHVTFMAHTLGPSSHENDSLAIKDVMSILEKETLSEVSFIEDFELNCREVEKIYSYYDYMIGTRFHSVIFSLNVNVPAIAIAYGGNKGKGIMNVLSNDEYSIDMDKISEMSLVDMFCNLEKNREAYLANLTKKRKIIDRERERLVKQIQQKLVINV